MLVLHRFTMQGIGGIFIVVCALLAVVWSWTWIAASLVGGGLFVGTVVPAFGALLEALAHAGRHVVDLADWLAGRALDRLASVRRALLLSLSMAPVLLVHPASAEPSSACTNRLLHITEGGFLSDLRIEPGERHVSSLGQPVELRPDDEVIVLDARTTAVVEQVFWGETKITELHGPDAMALLPCPPNRESWTGWWRAFWGARSLHADLTARSGTTHARGAAVGIPYLSGKLRELTNLAMADGGVAGVQGFAFALAGGSPPYEINLQDAASGTPLLGGTSETPEVWWPNWQLPGAPFTVVVRDAEGVEVSRSFRPLPRPSAPDDTAGAINLFESTSRGRLEALRRMRRLADIDPLARRAYEKVRVDGAGR